MTGVNQCSDTQPRQAILDEKIAKFHHAAWNLAIFSSGIPLSGVEEFAGKAPIESTYHGPLLMTGGAFGPEGSIITLVVVPACLWLVLRWAQQKNRYCSDASNI